QQSCGVTAPVRSESGHLLIQIESFRPFETSDKASQLFPDFVGYPLYVIGVPLADASDFLLAHSLSRNSYASEALIMY
ncbi:MAG: hypothetical protein KJO76_04030, partial [Gammaproteobacteria bacterium]|nr:hypothetical protein [Gammaproteobacteria bacterium]